jgi:plasmid maintenance system killer protein
VIKSFGDKQTEALFGDRFVREFQGMARSAKRKLEMLNAASRLDDFARTAIEPSGETPGNLA